MPAITKEALASLFQEAFDKTSDTKVNPKEARKQLANDLANAVEKYVVLRETIVTGTSTSGGPVTGSGIIQGD